MKITSAFAALFALAATAHAQTAAATDDQLYIALFQMKDTDKFAANVVDLIFSAMSGKILVVDPVDVQSIVTWQKECVKGSISRVEPTFEMNYTDFSKLDINAEDLAKINWMDPTDADRKTLIKLYSKILSKLKFEAKIYFVSNAELMAKPECAQNAIKQFFDSLPSFGAGVFQSTMYTAIPSASFETCVKTDSTGNPQPVCGNYVEATNPEEYKAQQACTACSISNSVIASTVAAAAMVAAALFF